MAELSPELAARIDQLSSSYEGNPARFFMPLASAYREAGDGARAEELLRENLKRHPGHQSAHVLLGRCLADRGAFAEAGNEFRYVLSVDPQNLVALRTLGEMAQQQGNPDEAGRWYRELLAVDPMNSDARAALEQLAVDAAAAGAAREAPPVLLEPSPVEDAGWGVVERRDDPDERTVPAAFEGEFAPAALETPIASSPEDEPTAGWGEVTLEAAAPAPEVDEAAPAAAQDFDAFGWGAVELADEPEAVEGLEAADFTAPADVETVSGLEVIDFATPADAAPVAGLEAADFTPPADDAPLAGLEVAPDFAFDVPGLSPDLPLEDDDEELVTETMAELYARQGLADRAVDVYRELIARRGPEPNLVRRLAELEASPAPDAAPAAPSFGDEPLAEDDLGLESTLPDLPLETTLAGAAPSDADPFADSFAHGFEGLPEMSSASDVEADVSAPADLVVLEVETASSTADDFSAFEIEADPGSPADDVASTEPEAEGDAGSRADDLAVAEEPAPWEPPSVEPLAAEELTVAEAAAVDAVIEEAVVMDEEPALAPSPPTDPPAGGRTMAGYFATLLAWRPGAHAAAAEEPVAEEPAVEPVAAQEPWVDASPAETPSAEAEPWAPSAEPSMDAPAAEPAPWDASPEPSVEAPASDAAPWDVSTEASVEAPAADAAPWDAPAESAEAPASTDTFDEPWATAPADETPVAPAEETPSWLAAEAPAAAPSPAFDGFDLVDTPVAPPTGSAQPRTDAAPPSDVGAFELTPDALDAPPAPEPPAREAPRGADGFSFEDFFSGAPPADEPAPPAPAEPSAAAEPAPPPPAAAEDEEDLEEFQAWLQSLKR